MPNITVNWTITPSQRMELLNALLLAQRKKRSPKFKFPQESADLSTLIDLTAALPCGASGCSYCDATSASQYEEMDNQ